MAAETESIDRPVNIAIVPPRRENTPEFHKKKKPANIYIFGFFLSPSQTVSNDILRYPPLFFKNEEKKNSFDPLRLPSRQLPSRFFIKFFFIHFERWHFKLN